MTVLEFLHGERDGDQLVFQLGRDLQGALEREFGGVVAAAALSTARTVAGQRRCISFDCRFLQALPAGRVTGEAEVLRRGRTLTFVRATLRDAKGEVSAVADATFVDDASLYDLDDAGMVRPGASVSYAEASPWQLRKVEAPIVGTLGPRVALTDPGLMATVIQAPWQESGRAPELACLAGALCVGPPVARELAEEWVPHPTPDLSLRFAAEDVASDEVAAVARLERVGSGVAVVRFEVFCGLELVAVGCSASILLGTGVVSPQERSR